MSTNCHCNGLACTLRKTLLCTCGVRMSRSLIRACGLDSPDLNLMDYTIWGHYSSNCTRARNSTPLISWSRRSCWSGAHCHSALLIIASANGDVVCNVLWIRIADASNTCFSVLAAKSLLQTSWNIFYSTSRFSCQIISLRQTHWYTWCLLVCYAFIKILLASRHLWLFLVYMCQKLLNFVNAFQCYKQKWKLVPLNLAYTVCNS